MNKNRSYIFITLIILASALISYELGYKIGYNDGDIEGFSRGCEDTANYMTYHVYASAPAGTIIDLENGTKKTIYNSDFFENHTMKQESMKRLGL
jgi:hypothetical protein